MTKQNVLCVEPDFWKKKEIVSFLLSIMVFFIHISSFAQYAHIEDGMSRINRIIEVIVHNSFTKYAVPLYFIMSGALFFRDYDDKKYVSKIKKRLLTLLVPYLIWNTVWMFFDIITSYTFISNYFIAREKFELSFASVMDAIFHFKSNGAFWFIFNLMVFMVLSPVIDKLIRNRYVGIATVAVLSVLCILKIGLPESIFSSRSSIVYYIVGSFIGKHCFKGFCKKSSLPIQIISAVVLLAVAVLLYFSDKIAPPGIFILVLLPGAWAFWNFADLFVYKLPDFPFYKNSFAIYAMHVNVSAIVSKLIYLAGPKAGWMAVPNFILTLVVTLGLIRLFCVVMNKISPKVYNLITGGR